MHVSASWFNPFDLSFNALILGVLLGIFIYWGWDSGVAVNEESRDSAEGPGKAAVLSTMLLVLIYLVVSTAARRSPARTSSATNSNDVLNALGQGRLRLALGQAADHRRAHVGVRVDPDDDPARPRGRRCRWRNGARSRRSFGRIHPRYLTPTVSTLGMGALSVVWTALLVGFDSNQNVLNDSITALGFAVCFYYGFTGLACGWYFRRELFKSVRGFVLAGLVPVLGGVMMGFVFVKAWIVEQRPELQLLDAALRHPDADRDRDRLVAARHPDHVSAAAKFRAVLPPQDGGGPAGAHLTVEPRLPSWWLEQALAAEGNPSPAPALSADATADVAIVGGGYTGLWTALALRERAPELRVTLLEAEICGDGPSGRNGGFVHGYWAVLASLLPLLGEEQALELAHAGERIVPGIRAWAESRGEDVWLREAGMLEVSAAPAQDSAVEQAVDAAARVSREDQAVSLTPEEVARRISSSVFRGGVFFPDGATVHPGLLVRALRRAALDAGVTLHEGTPVTAVRAGSPNELVTPGGILRAPDVVLATNAALTGWEPASRNLTNFGSYVVLTEPAPERLAEIGWTGGEAVVDGRMFLHYFRTTEDGRVLMGSGTGPIGFGGRIDDRFSRRSSDGSPRRGGAAAAAAGAARRARRAGVGRADRRLGRPPAVLPHQAGHADPLRRRLLGKRRRAELARRPDPGLARRRCRRRVDEAPARLARRAAPAAGAVPPGRGRPGALGDHGLRSGRGGGTPPTGRRPRRGRAARPARNGARHPLTQGVRSTVDAGAALRRRAARRPPERAGAAARRDAGGARRPPRARRGCAGSRR